MLRYHTDTQDIDELRGRLGTGRLDNAVWRIYADPVTNGALIVLRNADAYYVRATGLVRARWLSRLRGLRCVSATWVRVEGKNVVFVGTALGNLFALQIDDKYEKEDHLTKLWVAPNNERIDGIRVECVASKFIATVATTSALYLFSDSSSFQQLFEKHTVVNRSDTPIPYRVQQNVILPSDLQFMTGNSGLASRRFVWAASQGVTHAQLQVKRRRHQSDDEQSTVVASVVDKETISWARLKETSGSAVPLAVNLTAFHVLVLYPATVYAFNHISGQLTQRITLWSPPDASPHGRERHGWDAPNLFKSPAAGFARDVLTDSLWIFTADGEIARFVASNEEQIEAWKAAKAMGRFDLAMALAPLLSTGMPDDDTVFQTREAVLKAQADHKAKEGDWDIAAQLYAKTKRPMEQVILDIIEANDNETDSEVQVGRRMQTTQHVITYLVRKLDRTDASKPMQRTIIATLLVQLYASQLCCDAETEGRAEISKDFSHFLADHHQDLDTHTSVSVLTRNGCYGEAWKLAVLSGDLLSAAELSSRRGLVEETLSLLKLVTDRDMLSRLITSMCNNILSQSPRQVADGIFEALSNEEGICEDHMTVVQGLARVAREGGNDAYETAALHLSKVLKKSIPVDNTNRKQCNDLMRFLFQLHAEFGNEEEAQKCFEELIWPLLKEEGNGWVMDGMGSILRCAKGAGFKRLCVYVYQALGLYQTAIMEAIAIDTNLAESTVAQLEISDKKIWRLVAKTSGDGVGVVERSGGVLHIEDVLRDMELFESASERMKLAVEKSLNEHKQAANTAKEQAIQALKMTQQLGEDLDLARMHKEERERERYSENGYRVLNCGHKQGIEKNVGCVLCGRDAIEWIERCFDNGYSLSGSRRC